MTKFNVFGTKATERFVGLELPEEVKVFGDLVEFLNTKHNIDVTGFKVTWFANGDPLHNSSPETASANIPTTDGFSIALTPHTTNKGLGYNEMKSYVKEQRELAKSVGNKQIYDMIGDYTRLTLSEMTSLYNRLQPTNTTSTVAAVVTNDPVVVPTTKEMSNTEIRLGRLEVKLQDLEGRINGLAERLADIDELEENNATKLEQKSSNQWTHSVNLKPTIQVPAEILAFQRANGLNV